MTTLTGTMLTPGVSLNNRLYTKELIAKAYARLAERIKDGTHPAAMLTHHAAGDDSVRIVGKLTSVNLNGDNLDYTAELAPTVHGKTIESLVGEKYLRNVSIRGFWLGPVQTKMVDGQQVETADDLEVDGLDFTKTPGVIGATVAAATDSATETAERVLITETATARVAFSETVDTEPVFADNGYQADKIRRFPIGTAEQAHLSWTRIGLKTVSESYTAPQQKRIRGRIKAALIKHGVSMTDTTEVAQTSTTETEVRLSDVTECYDSVGTAGFSISAYNGPLTVSVSAYSGIEPADLGGVATAAMAAAIVAVQSMDPDADGDVDTGTSEGNKPDNTESHQGAPDQKEATVAETKAPAATTDAKPADKVEAPTGTTETVAEATVTITQAQLDEAVTAEVKKQLAAAATAPAAATETIEGEGATATSEAAPVTETAEVMEARIKASLIDEMRKNGTLGRKGLVESLDAPAKPLHEMSDEEFTAYRNKTLPALVIGQQ